MKKTFLTGLMAFTILAGANIAHAAQDKNLANYKDGSHVMLTGTAQNIMDDEFDLNYGNGSIHVEMEDWAWDKNLANYIQQGDKVTVSGQIDDDWFEKREIEANNVYFDKNYTYYYVYDLYPAYTASYNDDGEMKDYEDGTYISSRGTVEKISDNHFTLNSKNGGNMSVDVSELSYNPFDNGGIAVGDRVYVSGEIDDGFFSTQELDADVVVITKKINKKSKQSSN